jgi:DNA polymerase III sliding clamp (beta) subunit (PCNA family)
MVAQASLSLSDGFLILQARDGKSYARYREPFTREEGWQQSVLIPAKQLKQALQLLPKKTDVSLEAVFVQHQHVKRDGQDVSDAKSSARAKEIHLSAGDLCITISLLNDDFPDYQAFFADTTTRETQVVCSTADLLLAVKATGSAAEQQRSPLQFRVDEKQINLEIGYASSSSPALHQVLLVAKTGPDLNIALNSWYLRQALSVITTPQVKIEIGAPDKPVVLRPMSEQDTFVCAMTPMQTYE